MGRAVAGRDGFPRAGRSVASLTSQSLSAETPQREDDRGERDNKMPHGDGHSSKGLTNKVISLFLVGDYSS